jgi:hypothetical protein
MRKLFLPHEETKEQAYEREEWERRNGPWVDGHEDGWVTYEEEQRWSEELERFPPMDEMDFIDQYEHDHAVYD